MIKKLLQLLLNRQLKQLKFNLREYNPLIISGL
jgi:hypothetical protein